MKAIVCTRYGPPEMLQLVDLPVPVPQSGEVRIRIRATTVTSSDTYVRGLRLNRAYRLAARLALGWAAPRQPVLGMVLSGEVDCVGDSVSMFRPGDQVFGFDRHRFGAYAQYVCWPEDGLLAIRPPSLTDEDAAAIPYGGLLALSLLRRAEVGPGQEVLVYGASGAVGTSAVQLAGHLGARVTGVCGSSNRALVRSLGAVRTIDYTQEDFSAGPERYDVVLDAVGKRKSAAALKRCARVLTPGGRCISIDRGRPKLMREDLVLLGQLAQAGEIRSVIDRRFPLEDIVEAHRYVDGGHKRGNVVITVP
ncbi:MAG: NAD(P)-dependent alcohol dehydrogenase [Coriobacteriia bacterium]|nr:NAD(P)-dependent alcohol dehydrogenase [Coriobacteriia bacterium]